MANIDLDRTLTYVNDQVVRLSYQWMLFGQLFNTGADNIKILNDSGSSVFALLQRLMIDDLMISLSKLTDPARSRQFENASIYNMMAKAKALLSPTTSSQVDALICELKQHVHNIREHRNKSLAHADLDHALKLSALPPVTYDELEKAMTTVKEIITKVASEACRWTPQYNIIIPFGADAESLLKVLKRGHCIAVES